MKNKLSPLSQVIEKVFTKSSPRFLEIAFLFQLRRSWEEIAGKDFAKQAWPLGYKKQELFISLPNSAYLQEVHFVKETLRTKINKKFPLYQVKKIHLQIAK